MWAQSSMTFRPRALRDLRDASMSAMREPRCYGQDRARIGVIAASIFDASMHHVSGSMSTKHRLESLDQRGERRRVEGQRRYHTSSPRSRPAARSATSSAVVPPVVQMPYLAPWYARSAPRTGPPSRWARGSPPQLPDSSTRSGWRALGSSCCGHAGQGAVRTCVPPRTASGGAWQQVNRRPLRRGKRARQQPREGSRYTVPPSTSMRRP